jgi:uncharacterized protein (DUF2126 family)
MARTWKSFQVQEPRFVDSSLERLQVKVSGIVPDHILLCKDVESIKSTGTKGEYVAGIRYKAWNPPSCTQILVLTYP